MSSQSPKFYIGVSVIVVGLLALFLRESEMRSRAEAKARAFEEQLQSTTAEKSTLVEELEQQAATLQGHLADAQTHAQEIQAGRDADVSALNAQMEENKTAQETALAAKDQEIASMKTQSDAESQKLNALLQEKSGENQSLAADLEKASKKYSELTSDLEGASQKYNTLLQKKEALETRNLSLEKELAEARAALEICRRATSSLAAVVTGPAAASPGAPAAPQTGASPSAPDTADGLPQ